MAKKDSKLETLLEQPEAIIEDLQGGKFDEWFEEKKNIITYIGGGILAVIALVFFGKYYLTSQNEEAQNTMFQAVYYFEADSLNKALNGDGSNPGLVEIADGYGLTKSGKLASYYAGVCYLKLGKYDEAIDYLDNFSSDDILVQARAYALIGDAYMEKTDYENAISYYKKASNYKPTKQFTPDYLMKLALACELNKDYIGAIDAYNIIINEYPNSMKIADAKKYKALSEALSE
ncbi:MAG: cytochrome C biosynthesis protein [Bacteroidetes bacterium]|nr:MAG: cytochrome C biosynthesis protein [Bacteroidota bacterium]